MTQGMLHGDYGFKYKVGDVLVHLADHFDVITIRKRFIDSDTGVQYYYFRDWEGLKNLVDSGEVERNYRKKE